MRRVKAQRVSYGEHILCVYVVCYREPPYGCKEPFLIFIFENFYKNNFIFVFNPPALGKEYREVYEFQSQIGGNCDWNSSTMHSLSCF